MTAYRDPDRMIHDFLLEGEEQLDDQVFDAVRAEIEQKRQRAVFGPWRFPEMNKFLALGLGAAAVVVAVLIGAQFFGAPGGGLGSQPTPEPTSTPEPTATPDASPPPLTLTFTSRVHGYSVSYPAVWATRAATEPWTQSTFPLDFERSDIDVLYDPNLNSGGPFLAIASQPIGDSTPEDWISAQMSSEEGCSTHMAVTIDGFTGQIGRDGCDVAVVTAAGRGYWIQLYTGSEAPATYDHAWFEEVLATVQLYPEDAAD